VHGKAALKQDCVHIPLTFVRSHACHQKPTHRVVRPVGCSPHRMCNEPTEGGTLLACLMADWEYARIESSVTKAGPLARELHVHVYERG
jgi:hypothetical protein